MIGYFLVDLGIPDSPFVRTKGTSETFKKLADKAMKEVYGEVEQFELESGFKIDRDWINELAFKTQIVIKDSKLCYAHGRILYAALSKYLSQQNSLIKQDLIIIETGTARGFSSLCMAKALSDLGSSGKILTFDLIPNERKMFWNCIEDLEGEKTRLELLSKWRELVDRFIIFIEEILGKHLKLVRSAE